MHKQWGIKRKEISEVGKGSKSEPLVRLWHHSYMMGIGDRVLINHSDPNCSTVANFSFHYSQNVC